MKDRIGITIALVSFLIPCILVSIGCQPPPYASFTLDWEASVIQPTFCMYQDPCFQERLGIGGIIVWKVPRSFDQKKQWKIDTPWEIGAIAWGAGLKADELWEGSQTVWDLEYKVSDNFMKQLLGGRPSAVSRLTYGEVPPGYEEKVKALPLEPEEFYSVWIRGDGGELSKNTYFIIRLDTTGTPDRLEYLQDNFLITPRYAIAPRYSLKLY